MAVCLKAASVALVLSSTLVLIPATATATTISFTADLPGPRPNGFVSSESPLVSFSDTLNSDLFVFNFGPTGQGLAVGVADDSLLRMDFTQHVNSLEVAFGFDFVLGTRAWLLMFNGPTFVSLVSIEVNGDGLVNQTISFSGVAFNIAAFWFGNDVGTPLNQVEFIDNVTFNVVPEPATMLLLGTRTGQPGASTPPRVPLTPRSTGPHSRRHDGRHES